MRKKVIKQILTIAIILLVGVAITQYFSHDDYMTKEGWTVGAEYVSGDELLRDSNATGKADSTAHIKHHKNHTTHGPD